MRVTSLCCAAICIALVGCATTEVVEPKFERGAFAKEAFAARLRTKTQRDYVDTITRLIYRKFTYTGRMPSARPLEVGVRLRIGKGGTVMWAEVTYSSGIPELDQAVLRAFDDSSPWPAPPPWMAHTNIAFRVKVPDRTN
ncbi:cell envelope integrity protein TolA [Pandoraea sp.]|uniref:cell envelope integrity protein TolA n=1 Tax=Pandoraea sp. TaxID=1883445 RepID=UPI0035B4A7EB